MRRLEPLHVMSTLPVCACDLATCNNGNPEKIHGLPFSIGSRNKQAGDLLVQISGDDCRGLAPDDAAALLRGSEGTKVGIVAERPPSSAGDGGKAEKLDLIVTRRKFKVEGVVSKDATVGGTKVGVSAAVS